MLSFLFLNKDLNDFVKTIYLHGSSARGEMIEESDVDIFIDCENEDFIEKQAKAALSIFYNSNDFQKWRLLKFTPPISVNAGELEKWELKSTVASEGIILYSKKPSLIPAKREVLFILELPKNKKKYLSFIRSFFGRKEKGYKEYGILKEVKGKKLSSNIVTVLKENQQAIIEFLNKQKIDYSMKEVAVFD